MFNKASAAIVVSCATLLPATFAEAQDVPGCRTGSRCDQKCHWNGVVPYQYPTIAACKAYWGPRNTAVEQAIRDARTKSAKR
jgi:hypothetical protein